MDEATKLLLQALGALNHLPNRPVGNQRSRGNTYSLATRIDDYLRERGIDPYKGAIAASYEDLA